MKEIYTSRQELLIVADNVIHVLWEVRPLSTDIYLPQKPGLPPAKQKDLHSLLDYLYIPQKREFNNKVIDTTAEPEECEVNIEVESDDNSSRCECILTQPYFFNVLDLLK